MDKPRKHIFKSEWVHAVQLAGYHHPYTITYVDVDNFKAFNDHLGRNVGDQLLLVTAGTIRKKLRDTDFLARVDGDEFAILLPETGFKASGDLLDAVRDALLVAMGSHGWAATFSFGAVTFLAEPDSVNQTMIEAEQVLMAAKSRGKNQIVQVTLGTSSARDHIDRAVHV